MKKWKIWICSGLVLFPLLLQAQEGIVKFSDRIGVEFGAAGFFGNTVVPDQIRTSKSVYEYDDFQCGFPIADQVLSSVYGGVKYETFLFKNRAGVSAGLRFSGFLSEISADWNQNYFIWLLSQNETTTDYLTIENIRQRNYYLGVPLEIRYFTRKRSSFFNQYLKLGASVNYCLSTNNSIKFHDPAMGKYSGQIEEQLGKPTTFNAYIYPAFGFRFGKPENVWVNAEFNIPGFIIKRKAFPFIRSDAGIGMQLTVQMPLNKKFL